MRKFKVFLKVFVIVLVVAGLTAGGGVLMLRGRVKRLQGKNGFLTSDLGIAGAGAVLMSPDGERIHFLNTGHSDCILIESNGRFALVDAAEDSDNPTGRSALDLEGYEERVLAYLKRVAGDEQGKVTLDWVLGTHAHSDHIGGFDTLILDPDITVKKAFLKEYDENYISSYEVTRWDNRQVYEQMLDACAARGVEVVSDIPSDAWTFENFTVQFFNTGLIREGKVGENENAVGTLLTTGGKKVFLAADINNSVGTEDAIGPVIGKVNILKVGHHGYVGSTTAKFVKALSPDIAIVTNNSPAWQVNPQSLLALTRADTPIYVTGEHDGMIVDLTESHIALMEGLHGNLKVLT